MNDLPTRTEKGKQSSRIIRLIITTRPTGRFLESMTKLNFFSTSDNSLAQVVYFTEYKNLALHSVCRSRSTKGQQ